MYTVTVQYDGSADALLRMTGNTLQAVCNTFVHTMWKHYHDYLQADCNFTDCVQWCVAHGKSVTISYSSDE